METVNRALDSASHTIWGETHPQHQQQQQQHGEEPLSGVQGQGKPTDPYDGGNRDGTSIPVTALCLLNPTNRILKQSNPAPPPHNHQPPPKNQA